MDAASIAAGNKFQSTLPTRGATHNSIVERTYKLISIHAPHTGSDVGETA